MFENAPPNPGEIRALANQLLSWANHLSARSSPGRELTEEDRHELALGRAVAARDAARLRERTFPEIDFGNPAWLIALELYIQQGNGFRIAPERLPLVAFLPGETVERALEQLQRAGIAEIRPDSAKPPGLCVRLTGEGGRRMTGLLLQSMHLAGPVPNEDPGAEPATFAFPG